MQLHHHFELPQRTQDTWNLLNQIEDITPCLPGASATRAGDDRYDILMKMRFGPLDLAFRGALEIIESDPQALKLVVKSKAADAKGQGSASGTTTVTLSEIGDMTRADLTTDLMIGGRIAQMGRGMVGDVSNELLARFVANLKAKFLQDKKGPVAQPPSGDVDRESRAISSDGPAAPARQAEATAAEDVMDVGAAVRRAFWRRILNALFFWRTR